MYSSPIYQISKIKHKNSTQNSTQRLHLLYLFGNVYISAESCYFPVLNHFGSLVPPWLLQDWVSPPLLLPGLQLYHQTHEEGRTRHQKNVECVWRKCSESKITICTKKMYGLKKSSVSKKNVVYQT